MKKRTILQPPFGRILLIGILAMAACSAAAETTQTADGESPSATASLPFSFNGGKADVTNTAGMTETGLATNYNGELKFNSAGDIVIIHLSEAPAALAYIIKRNGNSTNDFGTFTVEESADGQSYTSVNTHMTSLSTSETELAPISLNSTSRYVRFRYATQKSDQCVFLSGIRIYSRRFTVGEAGWITHFTDEAFRMPEGAEGVIVTEKTDQQLTLNRQYAAGALVPAKTPLLIHAAPGTYNYEVVVSGTPVLNINKLHGNMYPGMINEVAYATEYYKLANGANGLGWYWGAANGACFEMGGFKAYLATHPNRLYLPSFDCIEEAVDETTELEETCAMEQATKIVRDGQLFIMKNGAIFNLQGQVVR